MLSINHDKSKTLKNSKSKHKIKTHATKNKQTIAHTLSRQFKLHNPSHSFPRIEKQSLHLNIICDNIYHSK